jgi:hypothetical protein
MAIPSGQRRFWAATSEILANVDVPHRTKISFVSPQNRRCKTLKINLTEYLQKQKPPLVVYE